MVTLITDIVNRKVYEVFLDERADSEVIVHNLDTVNVAFIKLEGNIITEMDNNTVRMRLDKKSKRAHCFVFIWV